MMICKCGRTLTDPMVCPSLIPDPDGQSLFCFPFLHRVYIPIDFTTEFNQLKQLVQLLVETDEDKMITIMCQDCGEPVEVAIQAKGSALYCPACREQRNRHTMETYRERHREEIRQKQRSKTIERRMQAAA